MNIEHAFASFENCIQRNPDITIWWRDDDVGVGSRRHFFSNRMHNRRLETILALVKKYSIPKVFAVIPHKFAQRGATQIRLLKQYGVHVAIHGIKHDNNTSSACQSEFPHGCNVKDAAKTILEYKEEFSYIFGDKFVPIFVPPWNSITPDLERKLLDNGFIAISKGNNSTEYSENNIDIDVIDWNTRQLRDECAILRDIINLIANNKTTIGIMGHHRVMDRRAAVFFDRLLQICGAKNG